MVVSWAVLLPQFPYSKSWFYRTIIQPGFNVDITVNLEFDGKPYTLHRILRCRKDHSDPRIPRISDIFNPLSQGWNEIDPDFTAFGMKMPTGEGVIINDPFLCGSSFKKRIGSQLFNWEFNLPTDYAPPIAIEDNADDPTEITVYASQQAYKSPNARLVFRGMSVVPAQGWGIFHSDGPDQFEFFGEETRNLPRYKYTARNRSMSWRSFAFAEFSKADWSLFRSPLQGLEKDMQKMENAKEPVCLEPRLGGGAGHAVTLEGMETNPQQSIANEAVSENMVPYRLENDVWVPDFESKGRLLLFNALKTKDNRRFMENPVYYPYRSNDPSHKIFSRKIKLGEKIIDFELRADGNPNKPLSDYEDVGGCVLFFPETGKIYMGGGGRPETYKISTFK